jgi:adenylate cyclase
VWAIPLLQGVENWCQDECFGWRAKRASKAKVVVVGLDDATLAGLPKPLTFLSPELGEVIDFLHDRGAAAIAVDITVSEELDGFEGLKGEEFCRAASRAGNVVLPIYRAGGRVVRPLTAWRACASGLGLVEMSPDPDHFLRRQVLAGQAGDEDYYQLAVALLKAAGRVDDAQPDGELRVNGRLVPLEADGSVRVNFMGPPGTVEEVSFKDVLAARRGGPPPDASFADAVVVIGGTAAALGDWHATPFANGTLRTLWARTPALMSGPEFQAQLAAALDDGAFLTTPVWLSSLPWSVAMGGLLGAALSRLSLAQGAVLAITHHFGWKLVCLAAFWWAWWRVEMVPMLLTGGVCFTAAFAFRWRWLRRTFGAFKGESIARALEDDPEHRFRRGEERELTVLFADVRDFTTFSEAHQPREVVALLNAYFDAVVPVLEHFGGALNQYMGDGVMVLFGAPDARPDHAEQAIRAAIELVRRVHDLKPQWEALGMPEFQVGVGVHTGPAVVGAVGSQNRLDYTAIGDTTNIAARIEAANKVMKPQSEVLASAETVGKLSGPLKQRLGVAAEPEPIQVKGRRGAVTVYRVPVDQGPGAAIGPGRGGKGGDA